MNVFHENSLYKKKILVTGASSGIGAQAAKQFASCGAELFLLGRDEKKLNDVSSQLRNFKNHTIIQSDLSREEEGFNVITNLPKEKLPLDGLFHAAGSELIKPINLTKCADLKLVFMSSVAAAISMSRSFTKKNIMSNNASVVFMSSVAAISGNPGMAAYSASKSAFEGLTKSLAIEFSHKKIRFNTLLAGAVESPMHERLLRNLQTNSIEEYRAKHPLGFGSTEDVSNMALFLMSDASQWITGTSICVDGGYSAK